MDEISSAPICAAIDVGSNTIHIVVARCFSSRLEILADELDIVRIGESVTATGAISSEKSSASIRTLQEYKALAEKLGAEQIFVVATEAIRQATNSDAFIAQVQAETGMQMRLISGIAEATLTFLGSTYEANNPDEVSVMDLGGGSLELVFARDMQISWRTSVPIGSGWLHDRFLPADPPPAEQIDIAERFLETAFQKMAIPHRAPLLIITGGSANSLLNLARQAFHYPEDQLQLSFNDLLRCQNLLSALEAQDLATLYGQPLARTRILLAGELIIKQMMRQLQLSTIQVSSHGIREGVLLAYARYGERWLETVSQDIQLPEDFASSAHKILTERLDSLLEWPEAVLKHEDIEAVHKMRVATRRLRAALDAYQPCCDPVPFAKLYRKIKKTADALGEARDADVQIHYLRSQLAELDDEGEQEGVRWLITQLQAYRKQRQHRLDVLLHKLDEKKLKVLLKKCLKGASK